MSTYTVGTAPIEIVRGRPWSLPMHWQDAATPPNAINITDFMITASLKWRGTTLAVPVTVTAATTGNFKLTLDPSQTANVPPGQIAKLHLEIVDTAGETHDFVVPILGENP
jgi:hypothetical protein